MLFNSYLFLLSLVYAESLLLLRPGLALERLVRVAEAPEEEELPHKVVQVGQGEGHLDKGRVIQVDDL